MKITKGIVKSTLSLMLLGIGLFGGQAWAASIVVNNFSFELPSLGGAGFTGCPISDWTCSPNTSSLGVYVPVSPTQYPIGSDGLGGGLIVPDGSQAGYIQTTGSFTQNTAATIADNTTYTLSVFVGHRHDSGYPSAVSINLTENGFFIPSTFTPVGDPGAGIWTNPTITFTTTTGAGDPFLGATLGIALVMNGTGGEVDFDNVTLQDSNQATVPESSTVVLLGSGLAALGLIRRRAAA